MYQYRIDYIGESNVPMSITVGEDDIKDTIVSLLLSNFITGVALA